MGFINISGTKVNSAPGTKIRNSSIVTSNLRLHLDPMNPKSNRGTPNSTSPVYSDAYTWYDLSPIGDHFGVIGGVGAIPTYNSGSLNFDGVDDFMTSTSYNLSTTRIYARNTFMHQTLNVNRISPNATNHTIEIWVKINNTLSQYAGVFASRLNEWGSILFDGYGVGGAARFFWQWDDASVGTNTLVELGKWYQVVVVLGPTYTVSIYINGKLDVAPQTVIDGNGSAASDYWTIAHDWRFRYRLACSIGPVRLYGTKLSANEILNNYNATKGRFGL